MTDDIDVERIAKALTDVNIKQITFSAYTDKDYFVQIREGTFFDCTCKDFENRGSWVGEPCKHIIALATTLGLATVGWDECCELMKETCPVKEDGNE